ncbi:MAG: type II secretion system protein [Desulfuromonadaceae bacterium]|nr:type II secretion system protein [Desulfuromonadaceae bacterium]
MNVITNQNGFTYIFALTVVMIMGIMLGMVGQSWKTVKQRELEEELIFRGDQVAEVINQGYLCKNSKPAQNTENLYLWAVNSPNGTILDDLVIGKEERCVNGINKIFRLRASASLDPTTNQQWQIITPVGDATRFSGVASDSMEEPFRKSFKEIYDSKLLDEKKHYSDWVFTRELKQTLP